MEGTLLVRFNALIIAKDNLPERFDLENKPTIEDLISAARKIEAYLELG